MIIKIHIKHLVVIDKFVLSEQEGVDYLNKVFSFIEGVEPITDLSSKQIAKLKRQIDKFSTCKTPGKPVIDVEFNVNSHEVATELIGFIVDCSDNESAIVSVANKLYK